MCFTKHALLKELNWQKGINKVYSAYILYKENYSLKVKHARLGQVILGQRYLYWSLF